MNIEHRLVYKDTIHINHMKRRLNTTLSPIAWKILTKYEEQYGNKNDVIERALKGFDKTHYLTRLGIKDFRVTINRMSMGEPGMDSLLEGGIPRGFLVVLTGPPGTGKTTLSLQFLIEGCKGGERGIYFSFEEDADQIARHGFRFGWNLKEYFEQGLLELFGMARMSFEQIIAILEDYKPQRVVFDSMNMVVNPTEFRKGPAWKEFLKTLKEADTVCLMVTEKTQHYDNFEFDEFDFMGDGIVFLDRVPGESEKFLLSIEKMRMTKSKNLPIPFRFGKNGIVSFPGEQVFTKER
ncbi:MAG: AAA family ATPase [Theionarchaea archaeon]|nr:AAA family ATPase [Theionarchaea archaeon]